MTIPDRAVARLIATRTGLDTAPGSIGDRARWRTCPLCRAWTLVGLDDHVAARTVAVDPTALTRSDELAALLAGRDTYQIHAHGERLTIRARDHWQIAGHPADTVHVAAAHRCGQPLGQPTPRPRRQEQPGDRPPF